MQVPDRSVRPTILAVALALASTALAYLVQPYVQQSDLEMIHLLAIVLIALRFGVRETLFACTVSMISFDYLFIPPHFAFALTDAKSALVFIGMFVVAAVISTLTQRMRQQEHVARLAAFQAEALYALNAELSGLAEVRQLAAVTVRHLERTFGGRATVLFTTPEGALEAPTDPAAFAQAEQAWIRRDYTQVDVAGGCSIWLPIVGLHSPLGVLGLSLPEAFRKDSEKGFLLAAFANQLATATERVLLAQAVRRTERETAAERVRNSLLSAVSHDLKTPLASMIAAGSTLLRSRATLDDDAVDALLGDIVGEGERLTQLIANVLSVSRLESPTVELRRVPQPLDEVLASVVDRVGSRFKGTEVHVDVPDDLPFVSVEPLLIEQVLWNLLENSIRHGGEGVTLEVRARTADHMVTVQVADDGPGIPEADRDKVFEKFYRGSGARTADGGVGLGLTICRAIVHAHGGRIAAREGMAGGALVEFTLPAVAGTPSVAGASLESEGAVTR